MERYYRILYAQVLNIDMFIIKIKLSQGSRN